MKEFYTTNLNKSSNSPMNGNFKPIDELDTAILPINHHQNNTHTGTSKDDFTDINYKEKKSHGSGLDANGK